VHPHTRELCVHNVPLKRHIYSTYTLTATDIKTETTGRNVRGKNKETVKYLVPLR